MEVRKAAHVEPSWRERGRTAAGIALLAGGLSAPALVVPAYARLVSTALVLAVVAGAGRLLVAAALALPHGPEAIEPDGPLPTVSVVVTAYDEADVLRETLAACRDLAYPAHKLEVLACYETASTDGTAAIAEAAARDRRIHAVAKERPPAGKAAATNPGIERATGDVIAVLDADQRLLPDALRRAVAHLQRPGVRCVTGRRYGTNPTDSPVALYATVEHHLVERVEFVARDRAGGLALFTGGQAFFDADVFAELGALDETVLLEDVEMACRVQAAGGSVRVDPGIVSLEHNPATLAGWWSQRVRWARGGMQVARAHLPDLLANPDCAARTRIDAVATFGPLLAVPPLVGAAPATLVGLAGVDVSPLLPAWWPAVLGAVPLVTLAVAALLFRADVRAGRTHAPQEVVAAATLAPYLLVQVLAVAAAFVDEFVLDRDVVYVTS